MGYAGVHIKYHFMFPQKASLSGYMLKLVVFNSGKIIVCIFCWLVPSGTSSFFPPVNHIWSYKIISLFAMSGNQPTINVSELPKAEFNPINSDIGTCNQLSSFYGALPFL